MAALGCSALATCLLAAVVVPGFITFRSRSKQSEAKATLKSAFTAQKYFYQEGRSAFDIHPAAVGFSPELGNRYAYAFSGHGPIQANTGAPSKEAVGVGVDTARYPDESTEVSLAGIPPELARAVGLWGQCPSCEITIVAAGNIDSDKTIDVWSISTADRPGIPAGVPHNHVNDLTD